MGDFLGVKFFFFQISLKNFTSEEVPRSSRAVANVVSGVRVTLVQQNVLSTLGTRLRSSGKDMYRKLGRAHVEGCCFTQ